MSQSSPDDGGSDRKNVHVDVDERFRLLANERRRVLLDVLATRRPPVALDALAAGVAAREDTAEESERVAITLHHHHLPLLDDVGVLTYDVSTHRVTACRATRRDLDPFA